jgi:hypothetical protein
MTGCYTTGMLFGIGKQLALQEQAKVLMAENMSKQVIFKVGEEVIVSLYGGLPLEGLDLCRWRKFTSKTMSVSRLVSIQVQSLPPTSNAAQFHSLRGYLQCQYWLNKTIRDMDPTEWGWTIRVITKLPNSEQSYKGKVKIDKYINRQNQSTTGKL